MTVPACLVCRDTGYVCENHPGQWWGGMCCDYREPGGTCEHGACHCGAGMPCPECCDQVPQDGSHKIEAVFTPRSGWTSHGHWFGPGPPRGPRPALTARCGGPSLCWKCAREALS